MCISPWVQVGLFIPVFIYHYIAIRQIPRGPPRTFVSSPSAGEADAEADIEGGSGSSESGVTEIKRYGGVGAARAGRSDSVAKSALDEDVEKVEIAVTEYAPRTQGRAVQ